MRGPVHTQLGATAKANPYNGRVDAPQTFYPLPALTNPTTDAYEETAYTLAATDGATCGHVVTGSQRLAMPSQWSVSGGSALITSQPILRRGGTGQSFGVNERWRVDANLGTEFQHNPTMGGAILEMGLPTAADAAMPFMEKFSPVLHYLATQSGAKLTIEGCTIPLDYNTNGEEVPNVGVHTSDRDTLALWWRCRQYVRIDFNWKPDVHRVTTWLYSPVDWDCSPCEHNMVSSCLHLTDWFFSAAESYDPVTKTATAVAGAAWSATDSQLIQIDRTQAVFTGAVNSTVGSPFTTQYGSVIISAASIGGGTLALGMAFTLDRDNRGVWPTHIDLSQGRAPAHPAPAADTNSGQILQLRSQSRIGRRAGWLGHRHYLITKGTVGEVRATVDSLFGRLQAFSGANLLPDFGELPTHVRAGTIDAIYGNN